MDSLQTKADGLIHPGYCRMIDLNPSTIVRQRAQLFKIAERLKILDFFNRKFDFKNSL